MANQAKSEKLKAKNSTEGLSKSEAKKGLERYGRNELEKKKEFSVFKLFIAQFTSPLIYVLVIAAIVTAVLGDWVDTTVIGLAVIVNTVLGFYQEFKAQKSLEALTAMLTPKATVIRDGQKQVIDARELVPGDICLLKIGDSVPADGVVVHEDSMFCNEAILTGESAPVEKYDCSENECETEIIKLREGFDKIENKYKVFMGTMVAVGVGRMLVVMTGKKTKMGKIAGSLAKTVEEKTPLQKKLASFSKLLAILVGIISVVLFVTGVLVGDPVVEMFETAVAVAVAAIPEGLVVALTVILALGMQRILKRKALVRRLLAAETLGSVSVICADKTGTLTEGKMKVTVVDFVDEKLGMASMIYCNDRQDPLEVAMWEWFKEKKMDPEAMAKSDKRLDSIPFSPEWKYIATLHKNRVFISGAPEVILSFCKLSGKQKKEWEKKFHEYGEQGLRFVGFAWRKRKVGENKLTKKSVTVGLNWLGLAVYEDPLRPNVGLSLKKATQAGIKVKVVTGDFKDTAVAVLKRLGIKVNENEVMEGSELTKVSDEQLKKVVGKIKLFTRTDPEQKLRIVAALQEKGEIVAMTGDGVNDAPALKKADIGIVVGEASDVAKGTADMVLFDSNFKTILAAVEEGRGIFENLRKIILYLLSDSFAEVILIGGSIVLGLPLPITAAQILWVNLVDDGLPDLALTMEPKDDDLLERPPRSAKEDLMNLEIKLLIGLISLVAGLMALGVFWWYTARGYSIEYARTVTFAVLGIDSLLYVFSSRSLRRPIWRENFFKNPWLILAVLGGLGLQLAALYVPVLQRLLETHALAWSEWVVVLVVAGIVIGLIEIVKWLFLMVKGDERTLPDGGRLS